MSEKFRKFASKASTAAGSPWAFLIAASLVIVWAVTGPFLGFSEVWQLTINTGTTIVTFLMVFLIQNAQNRDNEAIQLKLDELLRATKGARTDMVDLEELSDEDLQHLQRAFRQLRDQEDNPLADHADSLAAAVGRTQEGRQRASKSDHG